MQYRGKYLNLYNSLITVDTQCITYTFSEINELIFPNCLPTTAYSYPSQWWENSRSHTQANAWLDAGFKVSGVMENTITFEKINNDL